MRDQAESSSAVLVEAVTTVTGTVVATASEIKLFPNGGMVQSNITGFSASYDFTAGGVLEIQAGLNHPRYASLKRGRIA